jgi:hypothetical protein
MFYKNVTFTTAKNWADYCGTGDSRYLDDAARLADLPKGAQVVVAGEGWERQVILD